MGRLRIVLGDDHTLVRQGICKILQEQPDWQVVAQAGASGGTHVRAWLPLGMVRPEHVAEE